MLIIFFQRPFSLSGIHENPFIYKLWHMKRVRDRSISVENSSTSTAVSAALNIPLSLPRPTNLHLNYCDIKTSV